MLTELRKRIDENSEKFNKELAQLEENKNKDLEFLKEIESLKK